jgi:uncharacterized protein
VLACGVLDCQSCGACCFSESSSYVPLTGRDRVLLRGDAAALVREVDGAHYMAMDHGRCAALRIDRGAFVCAIYARRPAVCRELDRGTPACLEERALKRPVAAEARTAGDAASRSPR